MSTTKHSPMKHCKQLNTEGSHYIGCDKKVMRNRPSSTVKTEPVDNCKYALWSLFSTLEGCEILWSSCLYVCLSVRSVCWQSHISKTTCQDFTKFSVNVTCDCGSVLRWWQCIMLCISGFVDDVMFSYNGGNTVKAMAELFRLTGQMASLGVCIVANYAPWLVRWGQGWSLLWTVVLLRLIFLWSPYGIGQTIIFASCCLFFVLSSLFPRRISAAADWMSAILPQVVWP